MFRAVAGLKNLFRYGPTHHAGRPHRGALRLLTRMPSGEMDTFRANPVARGWVKALRLLIGLLFVGTGWLKVSGHNIRDGFGTATGPDPVMPLFNAMFAVRPYWWFLGAGQLLAGVLLLRSRTAMLGSLLCAPIVANIAVLIFALPFALADRVAVVLLALANAGLLVWDWPRLALLVAPPTAESSVTASVTDAWARRWVRVSAAGIAVTFVGAHLYLLIVSRGATVGARP